MANIKIENNLEKVGRGLSRVIKRFPKAFDQAVRISAKKSQVVMIKKSPKDSGKFAQSFFIERERPFVWVVDNKSKHKNYVEFGTGLFNENGPRKRIRPRRAKFMIFPVRKKYNLPIWKPEGSANSFYIVTRHMKGIKGQKPKRIFRSTIKRSQNILKEEVITLLNLIRKRIKKIGNP